MAIVGLIAGSSATAETASAAPFVHNLQLVSQTRIDRFIIEATYRADATSTSGAFTAVSATVISNNPATSVISGSLSFPDIPNGATVTSSNTFTIRHDLHTPFQNEFIGFQVAATPVNRPPTANAGPGQTVSVGSTVTLSGSGSSDPDGNPLTFLWTLVSRPAGSAALLSNPTSVGPTFLADRAGSYSITLMVNDGLLNSAPSTVIVSSVNTAPVANAGPGQTVTTGSTVTLNGSGSSDADGNQLTYSWSFVSRPSGSTATLSSLTSVAPSFTADLFGTYEVQLVVNDGIVNSAPATVNITTGNTPPTANAGPDQTKFVTNLVALNGSASTDIDGQALTFSWSFVSKAAGSAAALSNPTAVGPTFTIDTPGTYVVQLIVNDGIADSGPDTVVITTQNSPPVANAGPDQTAAVGATVTLNGSASSDVDGNALTYAWSIASRPSGSTATLSSPFAVSPTFIADVPGQYVLQLIVNDGFVNSATDTVVVNTGNSPPVANAGPDQTVGIRSVVTLNGAGSTDVDGNPLTYSWSFTSRPSGSAAALSSPTAAMPTFTADVPGTFVVQLIVNDGTVNSTPATVSVTTTNTAPTANAGPDQLVARGASVSLSGAASLDPEGAPLTYNWSVSSRPAGSTAVLSNPTSTTPNFTADLSGTYVIQLIVNDGFLSSTPDTVMITSGNVAPVANGGPDQTIPVGSTVLLSGSESSDADGNALTYSWSFTSRPAGSTASLANPTSVSSGFVADKPGTYVVQLIVNDGTTNSVPDTVVVTTQNRAPVANAGSDATGSVGTATTLNGSASSDPDSDALTYRWTIIAKPTESTATMVNPTSATPTLTPDVAGSYVIQLIVNDGALNSVPATVTITVPAGDCASLALINGFTHVCSITAPREVVTWTFTANAGDRIGIHIGELTDDTGNFTPWIRLWAPDGTSRGNAYGTGAAEIDGSIAPVAGTYLVLVASADGASVGTGTYRLTMTHTPGPITISAGDEGGPLINGGTHTGTITKGDLDVWTFTANAGDRIGVHIGELTDTGNFTPWIRLWAPDGTSRGNAYGTGAAEIDGSIAPVAGTYLVLVASADGASVGTGSYQLTMTHTPGPITISAGDEGGPLINGGTHTGTITKGDLDVWTFTVNAGDRIGIHIGELTDDTGNFTPWIRLWAPDGTSRGNAYGTGAAEIDGSIAPVAGTYLVLVASADGASVGTGTYQLTMTHTPGPITISAGDEGGPLINGGTHTGTITKGDLDVWTFTANAGDRIGVHIGELTDTGNFTPWIRLWAPDGTSRGNAYGTGAAEIDGSIAPVTGTYLVLVASADGASVGTGSYQLTMTHTPGPITISAGDEGGPLINGGTHTGTITKGDLDVWTFTANAGDRIGIHIGELTDDTGNFTPWIRLWAPDGTSRGNAYGTGAAEIDGSIAPVAGTYLVLVASADGASVGTGTYRLTMTHTPGPITISAGDEGGPLINGGTHTGTITKGDLDVWTFTANAGDRIGVHIGELTDTGNFTPWIRLWAPDGTSRGNAYGTGAAEIDGSIAPVTGTYLVLVASADGASVGTGTYQLTMTHAPGSSQFLQATVAPPD